MNRFALLAGAVVLGLSFTANTEVRADEHDHVLKPARRYAFGAYSHVDELALDVMRSANAVCWEMYRNYRYEPGYRQTYREAYEMLKTAEYIHELVHHHGRRSRVAHEIEELDKLFHHLEQDIQNWRRPRYYDPHHDFHGGGLDAKMEILETSLHHLMDDAGYKPNNTIAPRPEGGPDYGQAPPTNGYPPQYRSGNESNNNFAPPTETPPYATNPAARNK